MYSAKRYGNNLSIVMLDIDHFKNINDNYGHDIGDTVLVEYTKLISSNLRESDIFSRTGGEEFMIILPHSDIENASNIAEKLRKKIENHKLTVPITMSLGVTEYIKDEDEETYIKIVDDGIFQLKGADVYLDMRLEGWKVISKATGHPYPGFRDKGMSGPIEI